MTAPRIHHLVPQMYLRGFAKRRGQSWQVRVHERSTGRSSLRNVNRVFARRDWNTIVDDEGRTDFALVEEAYSEGIEAPAAPAFAAMRSDRFPLWEPYRQRLAMFLSAQLVRGRSPRENLRNHVVELQRLMMKVKVAHYSDRQWEEQVGFVPSDDLKQRLFHSEDHFELTPSTAFLLKAQLAGVEKIAELLYLRTWTLVRFDATCLVTGEEPFTFINPHGESWGYGVKTAEQMYLPVSPTRGLLLSHPWTSWPESLIDGTPDLAMRLNWAILSDQTNEAVVTHPDAERHPLPGVSLLSRPRPWPWPADPESAGPVWLQLASGRPESSSTPA